MPPVSTIEAEDLLRRAPREAANRRFVEAWLGWRGTGRLLPMRSAVQIGDVQDLLGRIMLFEVLAPDEILIKVAGTQLRDHVNFEATGKNFRDVTPPGHWPIRRYRMTKMAETPCGGLFITVDRATTGTGAFYETVTLPIEPDEAGRPRQLITNVMPIGDVRAAPLPTRAPVFDMADRFSFLDLGAGKPDRTEP